MLMLYPARSILAMDASPFGHSLALLPVVRALRASYPDSLLVGAAPCGTSELLTAQGLVDETISLGVVRRSDQGRSRGLKNVFGFAGRARRYNFDVVLDFSPNLETLLVSRLAMRARVFTPSRLPRVISILLDLRGTSPSAGQPSHSDHQNVLQQLGVEMCDKRFAIVPSVDEDARFERRLASSGSRGGELIVLLYGANPGSHSFWPVEAFVEIGIRLSNNFGARIIAADEPSDDSFSRAVGSLLPPGAIRLTEPRALELIAAIARASLVITDEPAIAQIATELRTPVVEIADAGSSTAPSSATHRLAKGSSRSRVSAESVYEMAGELIQENRSPSLFQRP